MSITRKVRQFWRKDLYIGPLIPGFLVFCALMVIIFLSWRTAKNDIAIQYKATLSQDTANVEDALKQRFSIYEDTLRSGAGLFGSSDNVTRDEWRTFVNSLTLPSRYPGIRGAGYISLVTQENKADFITGIRLEGLSNYDILPGGDRPDYAAVKYIVPTGDDNTNSQVTAALGYDMYAEAPRRAAMTQAATTGEPALTGRVNLNRGSGPDVPGFILFMPVYTKGLSLHSAADRNAALQGFVYAPFDTSDFFKSIFKSNTPNFSFAIYEEPGSKQAAYYISNSSYNLPDSTKASQSTLPLYGQNWVIAYKTRDAIVANSLRDRPRGVIYGGTVFAFVTAMMAYLLIQRRTSSQAFAEQLKLEEAKDDLLSLASHQLRTPATAVKQYVSMVKDGYAGKVNNKQAELLKMAYDSNERQLTIVDDLLYVARLDSGQAKLAYKSFDAVKLLKSVVEDQKPSVKARQQLIRVHASRQKLFIEADPNYTRMILENLLSNASKYSKSGKSIDVSIHTSGDIMYISFKDQGVGILNADFENAFQKFSRIPNELTRQSSGSGIGLYLARQLARLHNGDIVLESTLNFGSIFTVILPKKKYDAR